MTDAQILTDLDRALTATEAVVAGIAVGSPGSSAARCDTAPARRLLTRRNPLTPPFTAASACLRQDLLVIRELAEASALTAVVGACYPLARIADAYRHVDAGHKKGSIVVTLA